MDEPTTDWRFWQWILGGLCSILGGAVVGGWVARGKVDALVRDVDALKRDQARCQATLKDDIRAIVQTAVTDQAIRNSTHLEAIRTELAVLVALHAETQKDVQALFQRFDRRQNDLGIQGIDRRKN